MKECKDLSKTRDFFCSIFFFIFFFFLLLLVFVYYSATISSIMTATSLAVMDRRCTGECAAASSLLIGACICDVGECESANAGVNVFFLHETMTVLTRC